MTGDQWIATTASPVQMNAHVTTTAQPPQTILATEFVTWSVDPAGFATIDRLGRVTPVAIGSFNVVATVGDKSGRNPVRVLPDYSGNWSGEYRVTACSGGFDFRECPRIMTGEVGAGVQNGRYPFTLTLSQFRDQVTGTLREIRSNGDITLRSPGLFVSPGRSCSKPPCRSRITSRSA